jgi:glycerate-2-kinase
MTQLSAGRLAKHVYPARIVNITVNDYVWNYPGEEKEDAYRLGWGPCVPVSELRRREFEWTISSLMTHSLWRQFPPAARNALLNLEPEQYPQTVKDFENMGIKYQTIVLASPQDAAEAAARKSISMGVPSMILSSMLEGEAREVGIVFGAIAKEIAQNSRPLPPPCAIIAAGEKTVTLTEKSGEGGRNQEFVLSAALKIDGGHKIVIVSVGTDGTDGPTNIAGGIVDGFTLRRAKERGIDLIENLQKHNSAPVLISLDDAIYFDEPGNNLCDLSIIIVTE